MRPKVLLIAPVVLGLAFVAVKSGRQWLDRRAEERAREASLHNAPAPAPAPTFGSVVVASARLNFGAEVAANVLREIPWATGEQPKGAFAHIGDIVNRDGKRYILSRVEEGEPILASKITGPGQRANLAMLLHDGMKAATFRVDEVVGVGGFIMPGDHVDVLLTRIVDKGNAYSDVIIQNVRVLAIDQIDDDHADKPTIARSATVEVATEDAQRLIVAQNVGALSLVLRQPEGVASERSRRVSAADLLPRGPGSGDMPVGAAKTNTTVNVIRGRERAEYDVPAGRAP